MVYLSLNISLCARVITQACICTLELRISSWEVPLALGFSIFCCCCKWKKYSLDYVFTRKMIMGEVMVSGTILGHK